MLSKLLIHYYRIRYWLRYKEKLDSGATMVYYGFSFMKKDNIEMEYQRYLDKLAEIIQPNPRTIDELLSYLFSKYNAESIEIDERSYNHFYLNTQQAVNQKHIELKTTSDILEWLHYSKKSSKQFITKVNSDLSEEINQSSFNPHFLKLNPVDQVCVTTNLIYEVDIEETSRLISMKNVPDEIRHDIILYFGIDKKDILEKTIRYLRYANALRDSGQVDYKDLTSDNTTSEQRSTDKAKA